MVSLLIVDGSMNCITIYSGWIDELDHYSSLDIGHLRWLLVGCYSVSICFSLKLHAQFLIPTNASIRK